MLEATRWKKQEKRCAKLLTKYGGISLTQVDPDEICCLKVHGAEKADWYARIRAVSFTYSELLEYCYIIEFNFEKVSNYCDTKKQFRNALILIAYHELMHINEKGKLRKHDIQDFWHILKIFGIDKGRYRDAPNLLKIDAKKLAKKLIKNVKKSKKKEGSKR